MQDQNSIVLIDEIGNIDNQSDEQQLQQNSDDIHDETQEIIEEIQSPFENDPCMRSIQIIKTQSYQNNNDDLAFVVNELERFDHILQIKGEEGYEDLLKQCIQYLHYEFVPKGKFLFHYGDIGEKFYFIAKGKVSIHVPRPSKEIFKQEQNYQLRKYWGDQLDNQALTANERETANLHYQRARQKIIKYLEKYEHEKFFKKMQSGHPSNQKIFNKYFHPQYKSFGFYKQVNELKEGQSFGEVATISRKLRTASVFAEEDLHLFYMRGSDYLAIFQHQLYKLNFILKNLEKYFENLSKKQILDLSYLFEAFEHTLHLNQIIFKEGSERQYIYLIKSGSVAFKSSKGISLGIIGEGEFFGFENKKGNQSSIIKEKHYFSAVCIGNGTTVYRLKLQLLEEEEFQPALKEFGIKGFQKAEYYSKRAIHCQNIFDQNEANNPFNQELQMYSEFAAKSQFQNENQLSKAKNLRKLMNKLQIQRKFNQYLEENFLSKKAQSQPNFELSKVNQNSTSPNLNEFESKSTFTNLNDQLILQKNQSVADSGHISNQNNNNDNQIQSLFSIDQIGVLSYNSKKPNSASQQKSYNQLNNNNNNNQDIGEIQHFQFISKEEFEQTKNNIIKEQEKLRARKPQHFVPQELADNPLAKKISLKYVSSSSLVTPQSNAGTNKTPPQLSSFFNQQQQPSSPLKSPSSVSSPYKNPPSPYKNISSPSKNPSSPQKSLSPQKSQQNQIFSFFPSQITVQNTSPTATTTANLGNAAATNLGLTQSQQNNSMTNSSNFALQNNSVNSQLQKKVFKLPLNKRMSVDSLAHNALLAEQEQRKNYQQHKLHSVYNRREQRGSMIIQSIQITPKPSEQRNPSSQKQRVNSIEENHPNFMTPKQLSDSNKPSSNTILGKKISVFSATQPAPSINTFRSASFLNSSDRININIYQSPSTKTPSKSPLQNMLLKSNHTNSTINQASELYNPERSQGNVEIASSLNYLIPQTYINQQYQEPDEVLQIFPQSARPSQKSFLNTSNVNQQDQANCMSETLKKFNSTHNKMFDKKIIMNLAITDLNFPQNNKPSIQSLTLRSLTDFNQLKSKSIQNSSTQNQNSPILHPQSANHRRSLSHIPKNSPHDQFSSQKTVCKNKQYSQLFKKNNESKSLKKKQKIMPLLMNESETHDKLNQNKTDFNMNNLQISTSPNNTGQQLFIQSSKTYGLGGFTQRKKVPSLFSPSLNQQNYQKADQAYLNSKNQNQKTTAINLLSPTVSQSTRQIQQMPFCSIKQFLEGNENINQYKYDILFNQQQKNN
ncbi:cyclic nucleotide-binding domain protein (macronuclear) [Tetrahymena thermophila SB210]|uniref:Cyclic nucleotide-binding domain protein n=1 Tax=Tetrahymena thermophila (strain SB210) TaxID=312017 RepID=Q24FV8_TETTS|nr:cyclic nucleotide-binding domain protein [Tetrahymena thermophila SB210]EAS06652.2 cyclic nucleotide-binding domain protein [Tetrahymena thermophila SB210]|eukprot:XP_001026897.2 cyclic nucleotide-binding domain protein [Tetrahymena thermophila SB210]